MASSIKRVQTSVRKCQGLTMTQVVVCPADNAPPPVDTKVWVNGRHIRLVTPDDGALAHQTGVLAALNPGAMTVLSEIRPEHIAEMTYADEFDTSAGRPNSDSALFIVLKPGVDYEPGAPSFVVSSVVQTSDTARTEPAQMPAELPAQLPAYRYRLLGVYDSVSGDPIVDAVVTDVNSGSYVKTSATGSVNLVFLDEGTSPLKITHAGYRDLTLPVEIAATATAPMTLLMERAKPQ
jgi:hypothetical protein